MTCKVLPMPDGERKDLPANIVTMKLSDLKCPESLDHIIEESSYKYYCVQCGTYWNKRYE